MQGNAGRQLVSRGGKTTYTHADTSEEKSPARIDETNDTLITSVTYSPMLNVDEGKRENPKDADFLRTLKLF